MHHICNLFFLQILRISTALGMDGVLAMFFGLLLAGINATGEE
jgi:hypothetical protein